MYWKWFGARHSFCVPQPWMYPLVKNAVIKWKWKHKKIKNETCEKNSMIFLWKNFLKIVLVWKIESSKGVKNQNQNEPSKITCSNN